jgi:hypothetical protein
LHRGLRDRAGGTACKDCGRKKIKPDAFVFMIMLLFEETA